MDTRDRLAPNTKLLAKEKGDHVYRIDGATMSYISLPPDYIWVAYVLGITGTSVHEMLVKPRVYFDIDLSVGKVGWGVYAWDDHTCIRLFADYLREILETRVVVATASCPTKISYHVWCLDFGAANVTSMRELCSALIANAPIPEWLFDRGVYAVNKTMRILGSSKKGENRPLVLLPDISDTVDPSAYDWRFICGPCEREYTSKSADKSIARKAAMLPENYEKAAELIRLRYPGLRPVPSVTSIDTYRANSYGQWDCDICDATHTSDNASFVPYATGVRFICFSASRRDIQGTKAKRSIFIPYT